MYSIGTIGAEGALRHAAQVVRLTERLGDMYIYIYICIHTHVCIHIYIYIYTHTHIHMYIYVYIYIRVCMYILLLGSCI